MAQLPADRTKLAQAQGNMTPTFTASSQKLKDALTEIYDTNDLLNQKVNDHGAAPTLPHADKSVTRAKLADKVVGAGQLDDAAVGQSHHQDNGIPSRALPDNVILQRHMSDNSVGSAEIQAGAVTASKIPNGTINSQHIDATMLSAASLSTQAEFDKRGISVEKYANLVVAGDWTAAAQAAFDYAIQNKTDIFIGNNVLLNGSININRPVGDRTTIKVFGTGMFVKNNAGYMFTSTNADRNGGNIRFEGVKFQSVAGAGTNVFDGGKLIRMYFSGCNFLNVDSLLNIPNTAVFPNDYVQTVYLTDSCTVVGGADYFIKAPTMYDVNFTDSLCEARESFLYCNSLQMVKITHNVIEGLSAYVFHGCLNGGIIDISDNYFEYNMNSGIDKCYFKFNSSEITAATVTFENNFIVGTDAQKADADFYAVSFRTQYRNTRVGGNNSNISLYKITDVFSITPEFLRSAFQERIGTTGKYTVNTMPPMEVINGGKSLLRDMRMPFSAATINNRVTNVATTPANTAMAVYGGNNYFYYSVNTATPKAGFKINRKIHLNAELLYVIGVQGQASLGSASLGQTSVQPSTIFKILDGSNNLIWSTVLDWEKFTGVLPRRFDNTYSLPPFSVNIEGDYYLQIEFDNSGGNIPVNAGLSFASITVQQGTIASSASDPYVMDSAWNGEHLRVGVYSLWMDSVGRPRIKGSFPSSESDGTVIATRIETTTAAVTGNASPIYTNGVSLVRVAPATAVTGVALEAGVFGGQEVTVVNEAVAGNSVTFAAGGSNVADGSSDVISGGTARKFVWNSAKALWYRVQ